jgi:hypothetical protein
VDAFPSKPAAGSSGEVDALMLPRYRRATAEQKLAVVARLNAALIALKDGQLTASHPDWPEERRRRELRAWWLTPDGR